MKLEKIFAAVIAAVLAVSAMAAAASTAAGDNSSDSTPTINYSITIWYEKKGSEGFGGAEPAKLIDNNYIVNFGSDCDGYYANVYTYYDEYVCSVIIENGNAVFNINDIKHNYKIVLDEVSHGDEASDVSSAAGIIAESETI